MTRQEQEEAEQAAYEEHMQALYDEQNWMQQGENDVLRAKLEATQRERDAYHEAWAEAQARLDCGADATEAVREERSVLGLGVLLLVAAFLLERLVLRERRP